MYDHMFLSTTVISQPNDVTVCEGKEAVFTCVLNTTGVIVHSGTVQWKKIMPDTNGAEKLDPQHSNISFITSGNNIWTINLTITNMIKSYAGYYWFRLPPDDVCNVSLTVLTSMYVNRVEHTQCNIKLMLANTFIPHFLLKQYVYQYNH